jgi:hypothetical protein
MNEVSLKKVLRRIDDHRRAVARSTDQDVISTWDYLEDYAMRLAKAGVDHERAAVAKSPT